MENTEDRQALAISVSPGYLVPRRKTGEEVRFRVAGEVSSPVGSWEKTKPATADRPKKHAFRPRRVNWMGRVVLLWFLFVFVIYNLTALHLKAIYPEPPKEILPPQPWYIGESIKAKVNGKGLMWIYTGVYGWVDP
jgi:hypothetical protein